MATGNNMVKLVVQLLADAKNFASELGKGAKAVDDMAKEAAADLAKVSDTVEKEMKEAVEGIDAGMEKAEAAVKEFATEAETAMESIGADGMDKAVTEIETGMEKAEAAVDELKTAVEADATEMKEALTEASDKATQAMVDDAGRLRDAKGRFIKKGTEEYKQALAQMEQNTTRATNSIITDFTRAGVKAGAAIVKGVAAGTKAVREFADKAAQDMSRFGAALTRTGAILSGVVTVGLGGAAKSAANFESAMAKASAVLEDAEYNPEFIEKVRRGIDEIAVKFGVDATDAVLAFTDAIQSGVPAAQALDFLAIAAKGAVASGSKLSESTSFMISMMNAYNLKTDDAAASTKLWSEMMDATFQAIVVGRVEFKDLAAQIADLAPIAKQAGLDYKDMLAAIATSSLIGKPTSQVMTTLKAALSGLAIQEQRTTQTAEALGITFDLNTLQTKGLAKFTEELRVAISKNSKGLDVYKTKVDKTGKVTRTLDFHSEGVLEILIKLAGSLEAATAWADLLANEGQTLQEVIEGVHDATGALDKTMQRMIEQDPLFLWRQAWEALKATVRDVGRAVLEFLNPYLPAIFEIIFAMQEWAAANPKVVATLVAVASAVGAVGFALTAAGVALVAFAAIISALATIGLPFILVGLTVLLPVFALLAAGAALLVTNFDKIRAWVESKWPTVRDKLITYGRQIWAALQQAGQRLFAVLEGAGTRLLTWLEAKWPAILAFIGKAVDWITNTLIPAVTRGVEWFIGKVAKAFDWFSKNWPEIRQKLKEGFTELKELLAALWDALVKVWDAFMEILKVLEKAGVFDHWIHQAKGASAAFRVLAKVIGTVADRIAAMAKAVGDFVDSPSWGKFFNLIGQFAFALNPAGAALRLIGGSASSPTTYAPAPNTSSSMRLPTAPGVNAQAYRTNAAPATAGDGGSDNYYVTINQRTHESADDMLKRLGRELQRRRGGRV